MPLIGLLPFHMKQITYLLLRISDVTLVGAI